MAMPYFIWKGMDSRTMRMVVNDYPPIVRAKERTHEVVIPGRSGTLTMLEGDDVFEPVVKPCLCTALPHADIVALCGWLTGSGEVIFGNEKEYRYVARIDAQISFDKLLRGVKHRSFAIPFVCQPYKELAQPVPDIAVTGGSMVLYSPATLPSYPKIRIEGSGNAELTIGPDTLSFLNLTGSVVLDTLTGNLTNTEETALMNHLITGDMPRLVPGDNAVSYSGGITGLVITPQWRYL